MNGDSYYIVSGYGFDVELRTHQGPDAACRRAMWSLIANGYIEIEGTPDEMLAEFTVTSRIAVSS
jgi:hypothetical protein